MTEQLKNQEENMVKSLIVAILIAIFLKTFIIGTVKVNGSSMEPTLKHGDRLVMNIVSVRNGNINKGDVIVFRPESSSGDMYIKRVIGVEGDHIKIKEGDLYINGKKISEEYIHLGVYTKTYDNDEWLVAENQYFVLGDNRKPYASLDSRDLGLIDHSLIIGVANKMYFPTIKNVNYDI